MFLGKKEIIRLVREGVIGIDPFSEENVGPVSVDLTLGNTFRLFGPGEVDIFSDNFDPSQYGEVVEIGEGEFLEMKPGDMALGVTRERIRLPDNIMGILSGRSRFARIGLMVHVSSNIVHPGSNNHQVLEIVNLGKKTIRLYPGVRICQMAFAEVRGGEPLKGRYSHQTRP